jgi:uncharacterized membrane protein YphA (DoxX/SURF4 family)
MAHAIDTHGPGSVTHVGGRALLAAERPAWQAYAILRAGFAALPLIAGFDKFTGILVDWNRFLAPTLAEALPMDARTFMLLVGVIEMVAGILVAVMPRIGGWVVAAWLWGIIGNLFLLGNYYDIALRDFGLSLGAVALARLAAHFDGVRRLEA